jgi:hypothetical protein
MSIRADRALPGYGMNLIGVSGIGSMMNIVARAKCRVEAT